jgi:hypothetical protein
MRITACICIGLLLSQMVAWSQVQDDFSDGDFTSNPEWVGDDSLFIVSNQQLRSRGSIGKDISLSTENPFFANCEWRFWIRNAFSPSTQNFSRFYLLSDRENLKDSLNGYYIQLGGITGNNDSIMLFKQSGLNRTLLVGGRRGTVSKTNNLVRIRVLRSASGSWEVYSDTTGGFDFVLEGSALDNQFTSPGYMGTFFRFTSGNAQNFYLDDVYTGPIIIDLAPPSISEVTIRSATEILIQFNERIEPVSATEPANYDIDQGIGNPIAVEQLNATSVKLIFFTGLQSPRNYMLSVSNVEDQNGNAMQTEFFPFSYVIPKRGDILISEFFPDPSPTVGLPEQEFVELYNNSSFAITLNGWTLSDDSRTTIIPTVTIPADSFIILCSSTQVAQFQPFGRTVGVTSFPSLNNSGDEIIIRDEAGNLIDGWRYDMTWYDDPSKNAGGWTIELVNPLNPCLGKENYRVSINPLGGTPGTENSQWIKQADIEAPVLLNATVSSANELRLQFNEKLEPSSVSTAVFNIQPLVGVSQIELLPTEDAILITLVNSLLPNQLHQITVTGIRDCNGNIMASGTASFVNIVPDTARVFDVLIHEFMADPDPVVQLPNAEYIELYNRSNRIISLQNWTITDNTGRATLPNINIFPDSFIILTSTSNAVRFTGFNHVFGISGFPSLGNTEDELVLRDQLGRVIHAIQYNDSWYRDNVKRNGGWSLEMIDVNNPCSGAENWRASNHPSGGTPGRINSIKSTNRDRKKPDLIQSHLVAPNQLRLRFSETLDTISLLNPFNYRIQSLETPQSVALLAPFYNSVVLTYAQNFSDERVYRIIVDGIFDCSQNSISNLDYSDFAIPHEPTMGNVILNEILFDPRGSGADYVELYNPTNRAYDLSFLYLANASDDDQIRDFFQIAPHGYTLMPNDYVVLTDNAANIAQEYHVKFPLKVIEMRMPSYPNSSGRCIIMNQAGDRYEQLNYTDRWHFRLLDNRDGVALERIKPSLPVNEISNWTSAAASAGFGTPTYRNSQFMGQARAEGSLTVFPENFSPDNDGYNDVVSFTYEVGEPGFTGNMRIFDSNGRLVAEPMRGQILGVNGTVIWDGIDNQNKKASIGIYTVWFEYFNLTGEVFRTKKAFVLAGKL